MRRHHPSNRRHEFSYARRVPSDRESMVAALIRSTTSGARSGSAATAVTAGRIMRRKVGAGPRSSGARRRYGNATATSPPPKLQPWPRPAVTKATSSPSWPTPDCGGLSWSAYAWATSTWRHAGSTCAKPHPRWKGTSSSARRKPARPCEPSRSPGRHRGTQGAHRQPCAVRASHHLTQRRIPAIQQLAPPHPLDPGPADDAPGTVDDPRATAHLCEFGPRLGRRSALRPEDHEALHAHRHREHLQRPVFR